MPCGSCNKLSWNKRIPVLINIIFSLFFICHLFFIVNKLVNPDLPEVDVSNVELEDIDFPLVFRICINELSGNDAKYQAVGYNDSWDFFKGISRYDRSLVGWNGFKENGEILGSVKGI